MRKPFDLTPAETVLALAISKNTARPVPACDLFEDGHHAAGNAGADVVEQRAVAGVTLTMAAVPRPACLKHVACSFRVAP
ncbi:hypothetical protein [Burkholderia sp. Tr-20355]|uniref:hypothetical protein n=1 Tax=Burkholderia sp. Tr-20355 TaxID=2703895 RepID=UPI001F11E7A8|nr:hypothetical protein [Burkholderia sp. Tr-20355]